MEVKKETYIGDDIDELTRLLEDGIAKMAEKGWSPHREDMLSGTSVRVIFIRGAYDEEDEDALEALASLDD